MLIVILSEIFNRYICHKRPKLLIHLAADRALDAMLYASITDISITESINNLLADCFRRVVS